jgi:hypothetical protein
VGWLTIAPRSQRGWVAADAYVDVHELWLPSRSVSRVAIDLDRAGAVPDVVDIASAVRPWLEPGAALRVEGKDVAARLRWREPLRDAGFGYRGGNDHWSAFTVSGPPL